MLDWKNLVLETRVNGETRQKQNTSELIFDIPTLIETCSMGITLQPGDVIATGTPGKSDPPTIRWRGSSFLPIYSWSWNWKVPSNLSQVGRPR